MIRSNPKHPVKSIRQDTRTEHVIDISRSMLYEVRKDATTEMMGDEKEQYKLLWSYCAETMKANPYGNCKINVKPCAENQALFHGVYIYPGLLKKGLLIRYSSSLNLMAIFLKKESRSVAYSSWSGCKLAVYPFAYAVVERERYKPWKWFLENLAEDLRIHDSGAWN